MLFRSGVCWGLKVSEEQLWVRTRGRCQLMARAAGVIQALPPIARPGCRVSEPLTLSRLLLDDSDYNYDYGGKAEVSLCVCAGQGRAQPLPLAPRDAGRLRLPQLPPLRHALLIAFASNNACHMCTPGIRPHRLCLFTILSTVHIIRVIS